jgi:hypothetical protein
MEHVNVLSMILAVYVMWMVVTPCVASIVWLIGRIGNWINETDSAGVGFIGQWLLICWWSGFGCLWVMVWWMTRERRLTCFLKSVFLAPLAFWLVLMGVGVVWVGETARMGIHGQLCDSREHVDQLLDR